MKQQSNQPKKSEEKLQKYLANYGFANRRNVADLIKASVVRVNSKKCNVNTLVKTGDIVSIDGEEHIIDLNPEVELLIYHKPVGQVCSSKSRKLNESVFSSIPPRKKGKWIMVGRLDINTSGLLLFTNCGNFANFLAHPSSSIDREYLCRVYGDINDKTSLIYVACVANKIKTSVAPWNTILKMSESTIIKKIDLSLILPNKATFMF